MSGYQEHVAARDLRSIRVDLPRGDVEIERVEGDQVLVESGKPLRVEVQGDRLIISAGHGPHGPKAHARTRIDPGAADLGTFISETVAGAMDSLSDILEIGVFGADLRLGIPAILERPRIEAATGAGDLRAVGGTAEWHLRSGMGHISVTHCGGELTAHTGKGDLHVDGFSGPIHLQSGAGSLWLRQIAGEARGRTGHGEIQLEDCPAGGTLQSGAGDLRATRVGGAWNLRSGAGDIEVAAADGAALEVVTGSGDVSISGGAVAALRAQSSSGEIECSCLLAGPSHSLATGNGDISLILAEYPGARLQVITGHGEVNSEYPLVRVGKQGPPSFGSKRYVGNVGDSSIDVELRTSSGDISIARRAAERPPTPETIRAQATAEAAAASAATYDARAQVAAQAAAAQAVELEHAAPLEPPVPPPAPPPPAWPPMPEAPAPAERAAESPPAPGPAGSAAQLRILQSLQQGEITVEEASVLLEALGRGQG